MTIYGGQRDAPMDTVPKTNFQRDAGPSTALAGYVPALSPGQPASSEPRYEPFSARLRCRSANLMR
jgi:hypothetical protein